MRYVKAVLLGMTFVTVWSVAAIVLAFRGWWMTSAVAPGDRPAFFTWAVENIEASNKGGSALVLMDGGEIVDTYFSNGVDRHTLFPMASLSKWVTALNVMTFVESGELNLDTPVSTYLTRWALPDSGYDTQAITTRRLLSHTAGLTDRLGFGDYEADETVPTLEESLGGARAADGSMVELEIGIEPGREFLYSGGGYLILELLIEELSGRSFAEAMQRRIFDPIGMNRSTYAYLGSQDNAVRSYTMDGSVAPTYQYASAAATGLSSSTDDLKKLVAAVMSESEGGLLAETITTMRAPEASIWGSAIWGLGTMLYVQGPNGDYIFGHDGSNDPAINSSVRINPETGTAMIALVSGHPSLASDIGAEWVLWQTGYPDFLSTDAAIESAVPVVLLGILLSALIVLWRIRSTRM